RGLDGGAERLFRDWLVANLVADPGADGGRFGYQGQGQGSSLADTLRAGGEVVEDRVHQFAAVYYGLDLSGPAELRVETAPTVALVGADDVHGSFFWSLRGDNRDTRLTHQFDLSGLERASLRFRVWHDLEPDYDQCYTLASSDGATW